ncbi:MAG: iron-containing alcohol dehydrogenase [Chloroflexota bacterium]
MPFEFATATRIIFGAGKIQDIGSIASAMGKKIFVVTGSNPERSKPLLDLLSTADLKTETFSVGQEPTIPLIKDGTEQIRQVGSEVVISFGGGSVLDAGKAIAALATNPGDPLDYLEVIGKGQSLTNTPLPFIAIPTTAGTGAEVTKNAVLASPDHRVKVSLRSAAMLPDVALIDPELTYSVPPAITASTGMDAFTQVLEPFVSHLANPVTDGLCRIGLAYGARSLKRAYEDGSDQQAREDLALTSLLGGLALANAKLGAVHGFAGVLGGMYHAPHGAICARLLPPTMAANVQALRERDPENIAIKRYQEVAHIVTQNPSADITDGVSWVKALGERLQIAPLSSYGIKAEDFSIIVEKSAGSSSMKGNPITLTGRELVQILEAAM